MKNILLFAVLFWIAGLTHCQSQSSAEPLDWTEGIVWYQIFPERYYNANPVNDPKASEVPNTEDMPNWQIHPWTSDWYTIQPWEIEKSDKFYDVVFQRRYGGDLIGVVERLEYLKNLGVDAIYFNPVFESPSLHKYDASTFHHIDDNFGPNPAQDKARIAAANENENPDTWIWTSADSLFLQLIKEAHQRGIRVVIDGVFNHTGDTFFAMEDLKKYGKKSRYAHWYHVTSWDNPDTPENEFDYEGWWGYKTLPVFAENDSGIVAEPKQYIFDITRRWMDPDGDGDPSDGIDGWRLDVMNEVAPPFWRDWYAHVKSINPSAITVAEIWEDASDWIADNRVDGTMNYLLAKAVKRFFIDQDSSITGREFNNRVNHILETYSLSTAKHLWNLMDSHDTDRLGSMILNPDSNYDRNNSPRWNPDYNVHKPGKSARKIHQQIAAFQMTCIGAPVIYYGDEAGMWGADDPDDRKPMVWPEMNFADETQHPLVGKSRPADPNFFDQNLHEYYRSIIQLRHDNPALMTGDYSPLTKIIAEQTFAFKRWTSDQEIVVLFNSSSEKLPVTVPATDLMFNRYSNAFSDKSYEVGGGGITLQVPANWYVVLVSQ